MSIYWDTSAILWYYSCGRTSEICGHTRPHSLAEAFSALTGSGLELVASDGTRRLRRFSPTLANRILRLAFSQLQFVELNAAEILDALAQAQAKAVQGGRVHDLLHAMAAEKCRADELWTLDRNDFVGLGKVRLFNPAEDERSAD